MADLVPTSDVANSAGWSLVGTGTGFWDRLNSISAPNDANYVSWDSTVAGSPSFTVRLNPTDPGVDDSVAIKLRVRSAGVLKDISGTINYGFTLNLYEGDPGAGGVIRASMPFDRAQGEAMATDEYTLTAGERTSVGDWGNLYLNVGNPSVSGTGDMLLNISEMGVDYTALAMGGSSTRKRSHLTTVGSG